MIAKVKSAAGPTRSAGMVLRRPASGALVPVSFESRTPTVRTSTAAVERGEISVTRRSTASCQRRRTIEEKRNALGRRAFLAAPLVLHSLGKYAKPAAAADAVSDSEEEIRRSIMLASNVVPALSVEQYKSAIARGKEAAWAQIRSDIDNEDFDQLSNSLLFGPFDEVQQSSFYLPWALLERDVSAAVRAREAYFPLSAAIDKFSEAAADGAKLNASADDVRQSFDAVDSALAAFLDQVP